MIGYERPTMYQTKDYELLENIVYSLIVFTEMWRHEIMS